MENEEHPSPSEYFRRALSNINNPPQGINEATINDLRRVPLSTVQSLKLARIAEVLESDAAKDSATREKLCIEARDIIERPEPPAENLSFRDAAYQQYLQWRAGRARTLVQELKEEARRHSPANRQTNEEHT